MTADFMFATSTTIIAIIATIATIATIAISNTSKEGVYSHGVDYHHRR
jgi:hypothetical protein